MDKDKAFELLELEIVELRRQAEVNRENAAKRGVNKSYKDRWLLSASWCDENANAFELVLNLAKGAK